MSTTLKSEGSLFDTGAEAIVNPVNCVGAMGKGLALEFKNRFPANFQAYSAECRAGHLHPGGLFAFEQPPPAAGQPRWVVNLATKGDWREPSQIEWIQRGAVMLRRWAEDYKVASIACPALGAGLGGLPWEPVKAALEKAFADSSVALLLFAPQGPAPAARTAWRPR